MNITLSTSATQLRDWVDYCDRYSRSVRQSNRLAIKREKLQRLTERWNLIDAAQASTVETSGHRPGDYESSDGVSRPVLA